MMTIVRVSVCVGVLFGLGCASPRPDLRGEIAAQGPVIERIATRAIEEGGIVGLSVAIASDGEIVYARGFGHVDAEASVPADADTVYDVASVGKQFTAAAVMRLVERGRLSLDTRVRAIVPELPGNFPDATIDELLRHTSGFVGAEWDELDPPPEAARKRYGVELLTDAELVGGRAVFEPGETWVYCNPGYLVLGVVVERVSGRRYDAFIREELLLPIGLTGMLVCERGEFPRMSRALHRTAEGVAEVPFIDMTYYSGQGSICSSALDLARWSHALSAGRVVDPGSLAAMRSPSQVSGDHDDALIPYGMAQRMGELAGHARVGHSGTFDGGSAVVMHYPAEGLDVAVISNTRGPGAPHALTLESEIAKALLGVRDPDVRSLEAPIPEGARERLRGSYYNGKRFEARFEGNDLLVSYDGREIERLVHVGGLRFRNLENPDVLEWFLMDGDRAGWWAYSVSGNSLEVLRRE